MKVKSENEVIEFLAKVLTDNGVNDIVIADVEYKKGKNPELTVFIDKDGGIDLNDCEKVHNLIDLPLDELNPTFDLPYTLNVSSLGLDRPFKTDKDFESHIGKGVEVKLKTAVKGKKFYEGELVSYSDENVVIKVKDKTLSLSRKTIEKVSNLIDLNL